jgi:tRNA(fMet)-specific endonuclease VapC
LADPLFLLDTNICICLLGGLSDAARDRLQDCAEGEVVTSAVVFAEVMLDLDRQKVQQTGASTRFFELVAVQPFDLAAAQAYARIPHRRGRFDQLIAAHALALDLTIVTNNEGDFADIPGLKLENWTLPLA